MTRPPLNEIPMREVIKRMIYDYAEITCIDQGEWSDELTVAYEARELIVEFDEGGNPMKAYRKGEL